MAARQGISWKHWMVLAGSMIALYLVLLTFMLAGSLPRGTPAILWERALDDYGRHVITHPNGQLSVLTNSGVERFDQSGSKLYSADIKAKSIDPFFSMHVPVALDGNDMALSIAKGREAGKRYYQLIFCEQDQVILSERVFRKPYGLLKLAVGEELLFVIGDVGQIAAVNRQDKVLWEFERPGGLRGMYETFYSTAACYATYEDNLYLIDMDLKLFALNRDGELAWERQLPPSSAWTYLKSTRDCTLLAISGPVLTAFGFDGQVLWRFDTGAEPEVPPVPPVKNADRPVRRSIDMPSVGPDGSIAFVDKQDTLYMLDSQGTLLWSDKLPSSFRTTQLAHGTDRSFYLLSYSGRLMKYQPSGYKSYIKQLSTLQRTLVLGSNGIVYELTNSQTIQARDVDRYVAPPPPPPDPDDCRLHGH